MGSPGSHCAVSASGKVSEYLLVETATGFAHPALDNAYQIFLEILGMLSGSII